MEQYEIIISLIIAIIFLTIFVGIVVIVKNLSASYLAIDTNEKLQPENIPVEPVRKHPAELPEYKEIPKQTVFTQTVFPQYEYKFISLNWVDTDIIRQIDNICMQHFAEGWDYYRLETSVVKHTPGCLGDLLGLKDFYTYHQYIVFRRPFSKKNTSLESSNRI